MEPDIDIATQIATALGMTLGTDVFHSHMLPPGTYVDHESIYVMASGGISPEPYLGQAGTHLFRSDLSIRIRSDVGAYTAGLALCRSVRDAVHTVPPAGYIDAVVQSSDPNYIGVDEQGHHDWRMGVQVWYQE